MSPVAQSINILQGEVEVQMGWLLPTISLLSSKLEKIKIALKHCKPLVEAIQVGIQNRFGEMLRPWIGCCSDSHPKIQNDLDQRWCYTENR